MARSMSSVPTDPVESLLDLPANCIKTPPSPPVAASHRASGSPHSLQYTLLQHRPPTFCWPVLGWIVPRAPELIPGLETPENGAQGTVSLASGHTPYDLQKSIPEYIPLMKPLQPPDHWRPE